MENEYYIPANSKRSLLIFGLFKPIDLAIFLIGLSLSFIFLLVFPAGQLFVSIIAVSPGLVAGFLVLPLPNYHNVRTFITNAWRFYTIRQRFIWKGWCVLSEQEREER